MNPTMIPLRWAQCLPEEVSYLFAIASMRWTACIPRIGNGRMRVNNDEEF